MEQPIDLIFGKETDPDGLSHPYVDMATEEGVSLLADELSVANARPGKREYLPIWNGERFVARLTIQRAANEYGVTWKVNK